MVVMQSFSIHYMSSNPKKRKKKGNNTDTAEYVQGEITSYN